MHAHTFYWSLILVQCNEWAAWIKITKFLCRKWKIGWTVVCQAACILLLDRWWKLNPFHVKSSTHFMRRFVEFHQYGSSWKLPTKRNCHRDYPKMGGGQNFERRNIERLKFRNVKVANITITKDEFFYSFFIVFFHFLDIIWILKIFNNFSNCEIFIFQMVK